MEGFLPRPEVTSVPRDYLSLKVTKYFTDIISYLCLLYFMGRTDPYMGQTDLYIGRTVKV